MGRHGRLQGSHIRPECRGYSRAKQWTVCTYLPSEKDAKFATPAEVMIPHRVNCEGLSWTGMTVSIGAWALGLDQFVPYI